MRFPQRSCLWMASLALALAWPIDAPAAPPPTTQGQAAVAALPTPAAASEAAARLVEKGVELGPPRLFAEEHGLAVDRTDPKEPTVVAYVGPSWIVPVQGEHAPGTAGPKALIINRGTGQLTARAHDVLTLPRLRVSYINNFQLAANALQPGDSFGTAVYGMGNQLILQLDLGGAERASLSIQPVAGDFDPLRGQGNLTRIQFGNVPGRMAVRQYGNARTQITAVSEDGLMASAFAQKNPAALEKRVKDVLRGLSERPQETMIWPADARPWLSGVDNWASSAYQVGDVGLWNPQDQAGPQPGLPLRAFYASVYVAARVLHPYELPPGALTDYLHGAKELSVKPVAVNGWIGTEKLVQFEAPTNYYPGRPAANRPGVTQAAYQARLLDLHKDVRRLLIRCQAPKDDFAKWARDFDKVIAHMRIPREPLEPVVVPLAPVGYQSKK